MFENDCGGQTADAAGPPPRNLDAPGGGAVINLPGRPAGTGDEQLADGRRRHRDSYVAVPPGGGASRVSARSVVLQFVERPRPNGRWPRARCITSYCTDVMWPIASIQYAALWAPGICM